MNTAATSVPGTGAIAHASDMPVYTAPASHVFEVAPAAHYLPLAPAGRVYIPPPQQSSGVGIHADHSA
jgi:hypothetical protein